MTFDQILAMSLDQITLAVQCVEICRLKRQDWFMRPIAAALGGEYEDSEVAPRNDESSRPGTKDNPARAQPRNKRRPRRKADPAFKSDYRPYDGKDRKQGEMSLRMGLGFMGLPVEQAGPKKGGGGD